MGRLLVGLLFPLACVTPSLPTDEEMAPPALAEEVVTPPQPAEEEAMPPPAEGQVELPLPGRATGWIGPTEILKYRWASGQTGTDLLEAVFRYKLEFAFLDFDQGDFVVLGLNTPEGLIDPPPALLSRLADYPNITSTSETYIPNWGRDSVRHKDFGGRGRAFIVEKLQVIDESTIEVEVRVQGGCKWVRRYRFEWRGGHWVPELLWYSVT